MKVSQTVQTVGLKPFPLPGDSVLAMVVKTRKVEAWDIPLPGFSRAHAHLPASYQGEPHE